MSTLTELTEQQKQDILHHARQAARYRALQWDNERAIESILGHDVEIGVEELAFDIDDPEHADCADHIQLEHLNLNPA